MLHTWEEGEQREQQVRISPQAAMRKTPAAPWAAQAEFISCRLREAPTKHVVGAVWSLFKQSGQVERPGFQLSPHSGVFESGSCVGSREAGLVETEEGLQGWLPSEAGSCLTSPAIPG